MENKSVLHFSALHEEKVIMDIHNNIDTKWGKNCKEIFKRHCIMAL